MDLYLACSQATSRLFTKRYSTSFSMASRLFEPAVRQHIYNIYGLTRLADEVVDSYRGPAAADIIDELERETYRALDRQYSANPIIHAFQSSAIACAIPRTLLVPFFASMRTDLTKTRFTTAQYTTYIHGSAEVVGLMCLHVFCLHDNGLYAELKLGAARLGAAYQKVNFLRDIAADQQSLGRYYFPVGSFDDFNDAVRDQIIADIDEDLAVARVAIDSLPRSTRGAVRASYNYYNLLLSKLRKTPAADLKTRRLRVSNLRKLSVLLITTGNGR